MMMKVAFLTSLLALIHGSVVAFQPSTHRNPTGTTSSIREESNIRLSAERSSSTEENDADNEASSQSEWTRRKWMTLSTRSAMTAAATTMLSSWPFATAAHAADDEVVAESSSFASIAARATQISKDMEQNQTASAVAIRKSDKSAYDFSLPVEGKSIPFGELIKQQEKLEDGFIKVKAILVVNIKQDDPVARQAIPELINLATKYGRTDGAFAVIVCPTDQGYYEPDTSQLIRLKLASEYGYGINPATIVTDKVNLLGTGSHPFWRWLQNTCRTPAGIGRIEGNFEKFLIDGRTGQPLRRYPRKYAPLNIADDIERVIAGKPLLPGRANYLEEWRQSEAEAKRDTYRFEKGLNYFDQ